MKLLVASAWNPQHRSRIPDDVRRHRKRSGRTTSAWHDKVPNHEFKWTLLWRGAASRVRTAASAIRI